MRRLLPIGMTVAAAMLLSSPAVARAQDADREHPAAKAQDTADKSGPRLTELVSPTWLTNWVAAAHRRSLLVALAGRLRAEDLPIVRRCGADVAGVRGAACDGGRGGRISPARVRDLRRACAAGVEMVALP